MNMIQTLSAQVNNFLSAEQYNDWLFALGESFVITDNIRRRELYVRGCENNLWMQVELFENSVKLHADSDSQMTLGIVHILQKILNDSVPDDVKSLTLYDIHEIIAPLSSVRKKGTQHILNYIKQCVDNQQ